MLTEKYCSASNWSCNSFICPSASCLSLQSKTNVVTFHLVYEALGKSGIKKKNTRHNGLAQFLVLFLQAALNVQQVIHFLLKLFLRGPERTELLVLSLQIILCQAALLSLLLDFQRHILHLRERNLYLVNDVTFFVFPSFFDGSPLPSTPWQQRLTSSVNWSLCLRSSSSFCRACL